MVASMRPVLTGAALALIALALVGCGVRGKLEEPSDAKAPSGTATADSGQGKPAGTAEKAHQGFILDGLLR